MQGDVSLFGSTVFLFACRRLRTKRKMVESKERKTYLLSAVLTPKVNRNYTYV